MSGKGLLTRIIRTGGLAVFQMFKKRRWKFALDRTVLLKNDISMLILDERWNNLFANKQKNDSIVRCETELKELLKQQSRLTNESAELAALKKNCMEKIIALTEEVFEKNNENAREEMHRCEKEIKRINERTRDIETELEELPEKIRQANLRLLRHTINAVYYDLLKNRKRKEELERQIEETRMKLKQLIEEKELLDEDNTEVYSYFHDLLGGEELEKLDRIFFKE